MRTGCSFALASTETSRMITRIAGCSLPGTATLRDAGNGPVETVKFCCSACTDIRRSPIAKVALGSGGGETGAADGRKGAGRNLFLFLRRNDPDQVQWVPACR